MDRSSLVVGGAVLIGIATFLGIAEWKPWRRRRK
jgi:hypothetical protein